MRVRSKLDSNKEEADYTDLWHAIVTYIYYGYDATIATPLWCIYICTTILHTGMNQQKFR